MLSAVLRSGLGSRLLEGFPMLAGDRITGAGEGFGCLGRISVAAQGGTVFNGQARGKDIALDYRAAAQMHQTYGSDLALHITEYNHVLGKNRGTDAAFGTDGKTGAVKMNDAINLAVHQQVFAAGDLSADLGQGSDHSGTFAWLHNNLAAPGQVGRSKCESGCLPDYTQHRGENTIDRRSVSFV